MVNVAKKLQKTANDFKKLQLSKRNAEYEEKLKAVKADCCSVMVVETACVQEFHDTENVKLIQVVMLKKSNGDEKK